MKELLIKEAELGHVEVLGDEEDEGAGSLGAVDDSVKGRVVDTVSLTELEKRSVFPPYPLSYNLTEGGLHGREYYKDILSYCQAPNTSKCLAKDENGRICQIRPEWISMVNERLRLIRKMLGLSQQEFANRIGKTLKTVQRWESGQYNIPDSALRLISHTFGVSYEWLKTGEGDMWEKAESVALPLQLSLIKDIIKELKRVEEEYEIDIPPDLFAEAVEAVYEEVIKELQKGEQDRERLIRRGVGKIIKFAG